MWRAEAMLPSLYRSTRLPVSVPAPVLPILRPLSDMEVAFTNNVRYKSSQNATDNELLEVATAPNASTLSSKEECEKKGGEWDNDDGCEFFKDAFEKDDAANPPLDTEITEKDPPKEQTTPAKEPPKNPKVTSKFSWLGGEHVIYIPDIVIHTIKELVDKGQVEAFGELSTMRANPVKVAKA